MDDPRILVVLLGLIVVVILALFVFLIVVLVIIFILLVVDGVIIAVHALQKHVVLVLRVVGDDLRRFQIQRVQVRTDGHHVVGREVHVGDACRAHLAVLGEGGLPVRLSHARASLLARRLVWTFGRGEDAAKSEG